MVAIIGQVAKITRRKSGDPSKIAKLTGLKSSVACRAWGQDGPVVVVVFVGSQWSFAEL